MSATPPIETTTTVTTIIPPSVPPTPLVESPPQPFGPPPAGAKVVAPLPTEPVVDPEAGPAMPVTAVPVPVPVNELTPTSLLLKRDSSQSGRSRYSESMHRSSPSRSPQRFETDPTDLRSTGIQLPVGTAPKRIVVCCDGTWQDGLSTKRDKYTNVLRLSRAVNYLDERFQPPMPQIVFYQSGVGTDPGFLSKMLDGALGSTLVDKVEEAYAFIAHNYAPGDEIFLFGFSRGAYTARMVAMLIGEIGVLDRRDMDHFPDIFMNFQELGENPSEQERIELEKFLAEYRSPDARGRLRADCDGDKFTIKCLGVWDTVGALGLPDELSLLNFNGKQKLFGFRDRHLGGHVEKAYQALALNEMRKDFNCTKFEQTEAGAQRGQVLKQCWFTGAHTDIGGGYEDHDLADITLAWMVAQISNILSLDTEYIHRTIDPPSAPWGTQRPHDSGSSGIFILAWKSPRTLPVIPRDRRTQETIHQSVLKQSSVNEDLMAIIEKDPGIVASLLPFEEEVKLRWAFNCDSQHAKAYEAKVHSGETAPTPRSPHEKGSSSGSGFLGTIIRTFSLKKKPKQRPPLQEISKSDPGKNDAAAEQVEKSKRRRSTLWSPVDRGAIKDKENRR